MTAFAQESKQATKVHTIKDNSLRITSKFIKYNGNDGPYIINDTLYRVTAGNKLITETSFSKDSLLVRVDNKDQDQFHLSLGSEYSIPQSIYPASNRIIVISDIEGNYNAFAGFLFANKVIDKNHNWIYDDGHLVLVGDFVDRGRNVTQVLWLIYKLDQQAEKKGGQVHFILGNHEVFNFQGNHKYNHGKYIKVGQEISGETNKRYAIKYLYSKHSELGKWLGTKNVIEKIGDYLFVHGGLSPEILQYDLDLDAINAKVRPQFEGFNKHQDEATDYLYSMRGPFWYRGLVMTTSKYPKIRETDLDAILRYYNAKKMVIGHTVVKRISSDYNAKIIRIDVSHGNKKFSTKTKGLLIENGQEYIIDAKGIKTEFSNQL